MQHSYFKSRFCSETLIIFQEDFYSFDIITLHKILFF